MVDLQRNLIATITYNLNYHITHNWVTATAEGHSTSPITHNIPKVVNHQQQKAPYQQLLIHQKLGGVQ